MLRRSGRPAAAAEVKYSFGAAPRGHSASLLYFSPRSHAIITDLSVVPAISLHPASNNPPAGSRMWRKHPPLLSPLQKHFVSQILCLDLLPAAPRRSNLTTRGCHWGSFTSWQHPRSCRRRLSPPVARRGRASSWGGGDVYFLLT